LSVLQKNIPYAYQFISLGARKPLGQAYLRENRKDDCRPQSFAKFLNSEAWNVSRCTIIVQKTDEIGVQFQALFRGGVNILYQTYPIMGDNYSGFIASVDSAWDLRRVGSVGMFFKLFFVQKRQIMF